MNRIACCLAMLLALTGCRSLTRTIEVPVYVHDTAYTVKEVRDSTYIDRWREVVTKGDTVFDTRVEYVYKERTVHDTMRVVQEVPVVVKETETIEVAKPLDWWRQTQIRLFWAMLAGIVGWLLWKYRRYIIAWIV